MTMIGAALLGQMLLGQSPTAGIAILGLSLAALLAERWWYPVSFRATWLSVLILTVFGYLYIREPLGWFFLAGLAIIVGTSLRAHLLYRRLQLLYAEALRPQQSEVAAAAAVGAAEQSGQPIYWRALLFGLIAVVVCALTWLIAFRLTGWHVDIVSWLLGMLIGRAVLGGAGDRSNTYLQLYAALLSGLAMLGGHYFVLRETLIQRSYIPVEGTYFKLFINTLLHEPGKIIGLWGLVLIAVGLFSAWHGAAERG